MALGLIGQKRGMTRLFTETGESVPVTVVEVMPNRVTRVKTRDTDGYNAIQITTGDRHRNRISKAEAGEFGKSGVDAGPASAFARKAMPRSRARCWSCPKETRRSRSASFRAGRRS